MGEGGEGGKKRQPREDGGWGGCTKRTTELLMRASRLALSTNACTHTYFKEHAGITWGMDFVSNYINCVPLPVPKQPTNNNTACCSIYVLSTVNFL